MFFRLLLLVTFVFMCNSEGITSPKLWLNLQFSSTHPVDDLRLKNPLRNFYTRDDLEGTHTLAIDEVPAKWHLEISNELDNTTLWLTPSWDSQRIRFNIRERTYELAYKVTCKMGFYGEKCDRMCISTPDRHYSCSTKGDKICHEGWTGENCEKRIDACTVNPCANGGICTIDGVTQFSCTCGAGFEGSLCEIIRPIQKEEDNVEKTLGISLLEVLLLAFCAALLISTVSLLLFYKKSEATFKTTKEVFPNQWQNQDIEALKLDRPAIPV